MEFSQRSNTAKRNILNKLKKQVEGADYGKLPDEIPFDYLHQSQAELELTFVRLLEQNHAQIIETSKETIPNVVFAELEKRAITSLLYGKDAPHSQVLETQLDAQPNANIQLIAYDFDLQTNKDKLFNQCPASITSSRWAIAQTGSIVLWPSAQEPRTMSLVPPVHFVVVKRQTLHNDFASLIKEQNWKEHMPTNALLISGPSKTADIQQTLAYGAHGPKELIVLLIDE